MNDAIVLAKQQALRIWQIVEVHPLATHEDEQTAGALLREIARVISEVDAARKIEKQPHLDGGREVDARYRQALDELERVDGLIRGRLRDAIQAREHARLEALEIARLGSAAEGSRALAALPADVRISGVSESWGYEVRAVHVAQVPAEYLMVDLTKVRAYIRDCIRTGQAPSIPGIDFEQVAQIRVRKS